MVNLFFASQFALVFIINPGISNNAVNNPSNRLNYMKSSKNKIEKILAAKALTACQQACKTKLQANYNVCTHVAPGYQAACLDKAFNNYEKCLAACN